MKDEGNRTPEGRAAALLEISLAINASLDLGQTLETIVRHTRSLLDCKDASIVLWDPGRAQFKSGASSNIGKEVKKRVRRSGGATRWVVDHAEPVIVPDARVDPFVANPMIPENGVMAYAGVPILRGEEVLGVLYSLYGEVHEASEDEIQLLSQLASMAAVAIQNARLLAATEEANTFKSSMIRMLAHDLNNPIQALLMNVECMDMYEQPGVEDWVELRETLEPPVQRMREIVDGVLRYEQFANAELSRETFDLNSVTRASVADHEADAEREGLRLSFEASSEPLQVRGDAFLLREAVGNLVSNAIKYTPSGGTVVVSSETDGIDHMVSVTDTGPGLSPEDQEKLFKPFVRLGTSDGVLGTGLGLNLVKTIMDRHGGTVTVQSEEGAGTTFVLSLPVCGVE